MDDAVEELINFRIGKKIRDLRTKKNLTQKELAETIGRSYQQLQKYENGKNRVSASTLYNISKELEIPVSELFPSTQCPISQNNCYHLEEDSNKFCHEQDNDKILELIKTCSNMQENELKGKLLNLLMSLVDR